MESEGVNHIGWVFSGQAEYEGGATSFLAHGAGERLVYVADDPNPNQWPKPLLAQGVVVVLSTAEVYGSERIVDASAQRAAFEHMVVQAVADGYRGLRVVADDTSLIAGPERLAAWLDWEHEAERFIAQNPFTALCAFDRRRADAEALAAVTSVHRATFCSTSGVSTSGVDQA